ncbi:calcium-activated chloride channel regulator 1-like [Ornithodoros turicata]|uniref:calcium-activated chloride channel regulator 1-like n=1 Tax=Ornithodoros turicata TaxID=34597 RepID=UPI00313A156A
MNSTCAGVVIASLLACLFCVDSSRIQLNENGYTGIVVALSARLQGSVAGRQLIPPLEALLRNVSISLFQSTRNRAFLEEVIVLIPKSWGPKETWARAPNPTVLWSSWQSYRDADIRVVPDGGPFDDNPHTVQYAGCGKMGRHLVLTSNFLHTLEDPTAKEKYGHPERLLVREWAKYRWGVFTEHGYPGDPLYPSYYLKGTDPSNVLPTLCTDQPVDVQWRSSSDQDCIRHVDPTTGHPLADVDCHLVLNRTQDTVFSSIMALQTLPNVNQFCDGGEHLHNEDAPSKQNALCNYRSTWDVIANHEDFRNRNQVGERLLGRTRFRYVQEPPLRVVFVIQVTSETMQKDRRRFVMQALGKFAMVDAPDDCRMGLVAFGEVETHPRLNLTLLQSSAVRSEISAKLPFPNPKLNTSLQDAVLKALQLLQNDRDVPSQVHNRSAAGGVILLISNGVTEARPASYLGKMLARAQVRLQSIIYPEANLEEENHLDVAVEQTGGMTWRVHESLINDQHGSVATLADLYDAFYSLLLRGHSSDETDNYVTLERREFGESEQGGPLSLSFDLDSSLSRQLYVILMGYDFNKYGLPSVASESLQLTAPLLTPRRTYTADNLGVYSFQSDLSYYAFKINDPSVGLWELLGEARTKSAQPVIAIAYAKPSTEEQPILLNVWLSRNASSVNASQAFILFAELKKGSRPVADAMVTAFIRHPKSGTVSRIQLIDNGAGDPDITARDGVYSRHFTGFTVTGRYDLRVEANDNDLSAVVIGTSGVETESRTPSDAEIPSCCGSRVPDAFSQKSSRFTRISHYGSFFVITQSADRDELPPSRVTDLRVTVIDNRRLAVTLNWTAPGNDFSEGQASKYELKMFNDKSNARHHFSSHGQLIGQWDLDGPYYDPPRPFGAAQTATIRLKTMESPKYFAIRALDDEGNAGPVSNVVEVVIIPPPTTTTTSTQPSSPWGGSVTSGSPSSGAHSSRDKLTASQLALIIAIPLAVLLISIIIIILLMARRRKAPPAKKSPNNNGSALPPPAKIPRDDIPPPAPEEDLKQTGRVDSAISPVNSWPATVLLDHYNKVQQAKQRHEPPPIMMVDDGVSLNSSTPSLYSKSDYGAAPRALKPSHDVAPSYNAAYSSSQHSLDRMGATRNITQV